MTETQAERDRRLSREAKRRRTGNCVDCGAVTRYSGKTHAVSLRCRQCAERRKGDAMIGQGPMQRRALRYLAKPRRYSELTAKFGTATPMLLNRLLRHGLIRRVSRGVYVRTKP